MRGLVYFQSLMCGPKTFAAFIVVAYLHSPYLAPQQLWIHIALTVRTSASYCLAWSSMGKTEGSRRSQGRANTNRISKPTSQTPQRPRRQPPQISRAEASKIGFGDLPAELRNLIYEFALQPSLGKSVRIVQHPLGSAEAISRRDCLAPAKRYAERPGLSCTSVMTSESTASSSLDQALEIYTAVSPSRHILSTPELSSTFLTMGTSPSMPLCISWYGLRSSSEKLRSRPQTLHRLYKPQASFPFNPLDQFRILQ